MPLKKFIYFPFHFFLRTLKLRVLQQSKTATDLVAWLNQASGGKAHDGIPANSIHSVLHASVQKVNWDIQRQFPGGFGATFSVLVRKTELRKKAFVIIAFILF